MIVGNKQPPLYQAALDADEAFSAAITLAYGPKATRWDLPHPTCATVEAARLAKIAADWDWLNYLQTNRSKKA